MNNPLLCDPETGVCEIPDTAAAVAIEPIAVKRLTLIYFTDPICSSCWGIEPQLKKFKLEYGHLFDIQYRMGGLLPSWDIYNSGGISKPSDVASHWDEVSHHYQMPIDGDVWLEDPLPSSYPPSVAYKAAELQDPGKADRFMRRIREMVFLEKKNITRWEHLSLAATQCGLDSTRLKEDMAGAAGLAFSADLDMGRQMGVRGFPTIFFRDSEQNQLTVYGSRPFEQYEQTLLKLVPEATKRAYDSSWESLFSMFPTLTTKEFAVLTGTEFTAAGTLLKELAAAGKIGKYATKNGMLWLAPSIPVQKK